MNAPMAIPDGEDNGASFRYRWLQRAEPWNATCLHRVSQIDLAVLYEETTAPGITVCGLEEDLIVPGIFSRMDAPRCRECARAMGVKTTGRGNPYNHDEAESYSVSARP